MGRLQERIAAVMAAGGGGGGVGGKDVEGAYDQDAKAIRGGWGG